MSTQPDTPPPTKLADLLEPEAVKRTKTFGDSAFLMSIAISAKRIADSAAQQGGLRSLGADAVTAMAVAAEFGNGTMIADVETYPDGKQVTHAVAVWEEPDEAR